jgi:hypothetical protein
MTKTQVLHLVDYRGSVHCATLLLVYRLHTELWSRRTLKSSGDKHTLGQLSACLVQAE